MHKNNDLWFGIFKIPMDFLMGVLAFLTAYKIRTFVDLIPGITLPLDLRNFPQMQEYITFGIIASLILLIFLAFQKSYSLQTYISLSEELQQVFIGTFHWFMGIIAYFFLIRGFPFSRLALFYTWILSVIFITGGRILMRSLRLMMLKKGKGRKNILFIGHNKTAEKLSKALEQSYAYKIIGALDNHPQKEIKKITYSGKPEDLKNILEFKKIDEIIQSKSDLSSEEIKNILDLCREYHVKFNFIPGILQIQQQNIDIENWNGIPLIKIKPTPLEKWGKIVKRIFDLIGSTFGLIILSPLFLIIAVLIKIDSKGPIFFKYLDDGTKAKRVGEKGRLFYCYKFRTMYPNTHNLRYSALAENNLRKDSPLVKIKNDPRITRFGSFLRKTSLDELPQLINVFKGEMSLVGPRPHLPEEVAKYDKHHKFVLSIKPGITGLPQISGRSDLNFEDEVKLDTYYIENWNLLMDIKILFQTIPALLKGYKE